MLQTQTPASMQAYVLACLSDAGFNRAECCRATGFTAPALSNLANGKSELSAAQLDALYNYYRSLPRMGSNNE